MATYSIHYSAVCVNCVGIKGDINENIIEYMIPSTDQPNDEEKYEDDDEVDTEKEGNNRGIPHKKPRLIGTLSLCGGVEKNQHLFKNTDILCFRNFNSKRIHSYIV